MVITCFSFATSTIFRIYIVYTYRTQTLQALNVEEQKKKYPFAKIIYMINIRKQNKKKVKYGKCAQAHVQEVWMKKNCIKI